jgi:hypothetical protein
MNNALRGPGIIVVTWRQLGRGLTRVEQVIAAIGVTYSFLAAFCLWPQGERNVVLSHDLTRGEAQAAWAYCLAFGLTAVTLARSALRIQQRSKR